MIFAKQDLLSLRTMTWYIINCNGLSFNFDILYNYYFDFRKLSLCSMIIGNIYSLRNKSTQEKVLTDTSSL